MGSAGIGNIVDLALYNCYNIDVINILQLQFKNLGEAVSNQWFPPSHFDRLAIFETLRGLIEAARIPQDMVSPQAMSLISP